MTSASEHLARGITQRRHSPGGLGLACSLNRCSTMIGIVTVSMPVEIRFSRTFTWLREHPGVEIVARDRAGSNADGIPQGAPDTATPKTNPKTVSKAVPKKVVETVTLKTVFEQLAEAQGCRRNRLSP